MARDGTKRGWFLLTVFTSAFLLFLVQPMIARMALPRVGGAPSGWNSAMLVYQTLLLAGYAYAHFLLGLAPRRPCCGASALPVCSRSVPTTCSQRVAARAMRLEKKIECCSASFGPLK